MSKSSKKVVLRSQAWSTIDSNMIPTVRSIVSYRECKHNHAANTGGYALDGCTQCMPIVFDGTSRALICVACGCHRNFHRREVISHVDAESSSTYHSS